MATKYGRIHEKKLFERILEEVKDYTKVRIMGIESGGVYLAEDVFYYLIGNNLKDVGIFSVDVSRKKRTIEHKDVLEKEIKENAPGFLYQAFLLPLDDDVREGTTRDIVEREIREYFIPVFGVSRYKYAAVVTKKGKDGKPLVPIYGGIIETAPPTKIPEGVEEREIIDEMSLHIPPFEYQYSNEGIITSMLSQGGEALKKYLSRFRGKKGLDPKISERLELMEKLSML